MSGMNAQAELDNAMRIAHTTYNAFRYAMKNQGPRDQALPSWGELPEEAQDGWLRAVVVTSASVEEVNNPLWSDLAKAAFETYARKAITWTTLEPRQQLAWQAAVRHLVNVLDLEDPFDVDIEEMESRWFSWVEAKLLQKGGQNESK